MKLTDELLKKTDELLQRVPKFEKTKDIVISRRLKVKRLKDIDLDTKSEIIYRVIVGKESVSEVAQYYGVKDQSVHYLMKQSKKNKEYILDQI